MRYLNRIALASLIWLVIGAALIVIGLPAIAPGGPSPGAGNRENTAFVFRSNTFPLDDVNNGLTANANLGSQANQNAFTMANGLLMAQYLILVFDVPGHMAEETKNAAKNVPRSIMTVYVLGSAINFALLLSYLYGSTRLINITTPGFGITGSCNTNNADLPPWSTNQLAGLPNDGVPLNKFSGGCILSNGYSFSYFPIGNVFYGAPRGLRERQRPHAPPVHPLRPSPARPQTRSLRASRAARRRKRLARGSTRAACRCTWAAAAT